MKRNSRNLFVVAFLSPALLLYIGFVIFPLIQAFQLSLYRWRGVSANRKFVGFENYSKLAGDDIFRKALGHNLWLLIIGGICIFALGLAIASAMQKDTRLVRATRAIVLFPQVISLAVVAILWMFLLDPGIGLLNAALSKANLGGLAHAWLGESATALPAVTVAFIWYAVGFYVMLFSAGMKGIPEEVIEAAELDGSRGFHKFRKIVWPLLWSVKRVAAVYVVVNVMNVFALVFLMTQGGPDRHTEVMLTYLYERAFADSQFGSAASLAVANFVVAMLLSLTILLWMRRDPTEARA
jgi:N-acetylglucosamine transport system permease protein